MRRHLAALLVAGAALTLPAAPASACVGTPCDQINAVCEIVRGSGCIK
jgi:hypothetical protein